MKIIGGRLGYVRVQNVRSIYRIKFAACRVKTESGLYARPISNKTAAEEIESATKPWHS